MQAQKSEAFRLRKTQIQTAYLQAVERLDTAEEMFQDAMYLFEKQCRCQVQMSHQASSLFYLAARKGHKDAASIASVAHRCKFKYAQMFTEFAKSKSPKANYFQWLRTRNYFYLIRAAATGWNIAYSTLLIQQNTALDAAGRDWIIEYGSRMALEEVMKSRFDLLPPQMRILHVLSARLDPGTEMARLDLLKSPSLHHLFYCTRFGYHCPTRLAQVLMNSPDLISKQSQRHYTALVEFVNGLAWTGYHFETVCMRLAEQVAKEYPNMGFDVFEFVLYALDCVDRVKATKKNALVTFMLVCKYHGCNRDLQRLLLVRGQAFLEADWYRTSELPQNKKLRK
jgi:hypothetical protein